MVESSPRRGAARQLRRLRALRAWFWEHRHRLSDWGWAVVAFPPTALFQSGVMPSLLPAGEQVLMFYPSAFSILASLAVNFGVPVLVFMAVLWRRTRPGVLLVLALLILVLFGSFVPAVFAVYTYAAWFSQRGRLLAWTGAYALTLMIQYRILDHQMTYAPGVGVSTVMTAMIFGLPLGFGLWIGTRRELIASLRERASRLEREQRLLAERVAAEERGRIAREMHDVVAHRVSLMVLHAGGLEVSAPDSRTAETADTIRATGREALAELRGVLGVLREASEEAPMAPQPTLVDVDRLLEEWRAVGMPVRRVDTGSPRLLAGPVERTAYRILQEGLTNAAKHATGTAVTIHLDFAPRELTVTVANGPAPSRDDPRPPGGGHGLVGLAERASRAGGVLDYGATPDGGWWLRALLPASSEKSG